MSKFLKQLQKIDARFENAFVIGQGFGLVEQLLAVYKTVFVQDTEHPGIVAKNLVYRMPASDLNQLANISTVYVGLDNLDALDKIVPRLLQQKPDYFVEGNEVIGRDKSKAFYANGYRATSQQGLFHVWKKIK